MEKTDELTFKSDDFKIMSYFGIIFWGLVFVSYSSGFFIKRALSRKNANIDNVPLNKLSKKLNQINNINKIIIIVLSVYNVISYLIQYKISMFLTMILLCYSLPIYFIFLSSIWTLAIDRQ
jgi:hypothetical protein